MTERVMNFNPGPGVLPLPALERAQQELLDFAGTGMSILEHSHRGKAYEPVHFEALALLRELLDVPQSHEILFMQGGATTQFALVPMNLRRDDHAGDYVISGNFAKRAFEEAAVVGRPRVAADTGVQGKYTRVPEPAELQLSADAPYVHITSNNTLFGTQYQAFPDTRGVPLVADMSSDILSRRIDVAKFGLIYAAAQKNLGPAGVTVVIIDKALLARARTDLPYVFRYALHAQQHSLYNTAPTFAIYMLRNVLAWAKAQGGLPELERRNREKAALVYAALDESAGFYRATAERASRSIMNAVFFLPSEALDAEFVAQAAQRGLVGLKGHRLTGGIRASLYNALPLEAAHKLVEFMREFRARHA